MDQINSVKVLSIDEERLKFRVILAVDAQTVSGGLAAATSLRGQYEWELPPLTSFGFSDHYDQVSMTCDHYCAYTTIGTNDAVWSDGAAIGRVAAVELVVMGGGSQTSSNYQLNVGEKDVGNPQVGGTRQLVPLTLKLIGDGAGAIAGAQSYAWDGEGAGEPVLAPNPFGKKFTVRTIHPEFNEKLFLVSNAVGAGDSDKGVYIYQFTMTMVPRH